MEFILWVIVYLLSFPVLLLSFTFIIFLEAILLRRLIPDIKASRDSAIMNITTWALIAILTITFFDLLDSFLYDFSELGVFLFPYFTALVLSIFFESGMLKLLETKTSFSQILHAVSITNLASFVMLGLSIGLFFEGYEFVDEYENVGYILLCGLPIALFAILLKLIRANFSATASTKTTEIS